MGRWNRWGIVGVMLLMLASCGGGDPVATSSTDGVSLVTPTSDTTGTGAVGVTPTGTANPYLAPVDCTAAMAFWNDLFSRQTWIGIIEVNDSNLVSSSPIRLQTDSWSNDIPEIPNRYPGQGMSISVEAYQITFGTCQPGKGLPVTLQIIERWYAVYNGQYSPLFIATISAPVDITQPVDPVHPFAVAAWTFVGKSGGTPGTKLLETNVGALDPSVVAGGFYAAMLQSATLRRERPGP